MFRKFHLGDTLFRYRSSGGQTFFYMVFDQPINHTIFLAIMKFYVNVQFHVNVTVQVKIETFSTAKYNEFKISSFEGKCEQNLGMIMFDIFQI